MHAIDLIKMNKKKLVHFDIYYHNDWCILSKNLGQISKHARNSASKTCTLTFLVKKKNTKQVNQPI